MKKQLLLLAFLFISFSLFAQEKDSSGNVTFKPSIFSKWKMTGLDFYYSNTSFNTGIDKYDYIYLDQKYSSGSNTQRTSFNPNLLNEKKSSYLRHNFHADLVFTRFFNKRFLQSQEFRLGASYGYVSANLAEQHPLYSGDSSWSNGDTIFRKSLSYSHAERAASINLTWLLNFRLTQFVAVYGGARLTATPFHQLRILYDYASSRSLFVPPAPSPTILSKHTEVGTNVLGPKNSWSASAIAGVKFNLDCRWNVFAEYQWTYRELIFKGRSMQNSGSGFQAGFRIKFGRMVEEDDEKAQEQNKIFW